MNGVFEPVERVTASQIVTRQLKEAILSGKMEPGTKLPSERELAVQMKVSRPVIREAIVTLSSYGLVTCRQGEGNFVADRFSESVLGFMGFSNTLTAENYEFFFDTRLLFEKGTVEAIIENATEDKIQVLREINSTFGKVAESEEYVYAEVEFHRNIMKLCNNPLIVELYTIVLKFMQISASYLLHSENIIKEALEAHNQIIDAIEQKDKKKCERAIENHLNIARNNMKNYFKEH